MHPTNCLNCGTLLTADDNFCPHCGQKSHTHRLTISHILHEFFHSFTHADKGFLGLTADLALRPAVVAREYIGGKRKKYFNPFTYYLLCVAILVFCANVFNTFQQQIPIDQNVVQRLPTEAQKKQYIGIVTRVNTANGFIKKNFNTIVLLALPLFSFLSWLFFRKRGYNYAELTVTYMLYSSFSSLFFAIFIVPWTHIGNISAAFYVLGAGAVLQLLYNSIAHYRFFKFKNPFAVLLPILMNLVGTILIFLAMIFTMTYYIFRSDWWTVLKSTVKKILG